MSISNVISGPSDLIRGARTALDAQTLLGHLEKLLSLPIADSPGVNVNESERERNGIIRRQFCGGRQLRAIFRGALKSNIQVSVLAAGIVQWRGAKKNQVRFCCPAANFSDIFCCTHRICRGRRSDLT
jgi:hypothetical protein